MTLAQFLAGWAAVATVAGLVLGRALWLMGTELDEQARDIDGLRADIDRRLEIRDREQATWRITFAHSVRAQAEILTDHNASLHQLIAGQCKDTDRIDALEAGRAIYSETYSLN